MFYINFFIEGFIITISVIILPILISWYKPESLLRLGVIVAIASPSFRLFTLLLAGHPLIEAFGMTWPEVFFYLCYALIMELWYQRRTRSLGNFIAAVFLGDYVSNLLEIGLRLNTVIIPFDFFRGLGLIAVVRTGLVLTFIILIRRFKTFMMNQAHEEHYQNLLLLTSNFWSEIYFMKKNMIYIENLMAKAFSLYNHTKEISASSEIIEMSLDIAKEVHEVKKDYIRVIQGLEAVTEKQLFELDMTIREIINIVVTNTRNCLEAKEQQVHIIDRIHSNAPVKYHFYMTSIIRNLIGNAVEAVNDQALGHITIDCEDDGDTLTLFVADNGSGIAKKNIPYIFNPGFSTKFENSTGDSKRGVGLVVVKNLVEQVFNGHIVVESHEGQGSKFIVTFNLNVLKEGS